jgi:hypothetical protein
MTMTASNSINRSLHVHNNSLQSHLMVKSMYMTWQLHGLHRQYHAWKQNRYKYDTKQMRLTCATLAERSVPEGLMQGERKRDDKTEDAGKEDSDEGGEDLDERKWDGKSKK